MKFISVYFESGGGALVKFIDFRQPKTIKTAHSQQRATKIWQQSCRTICRILVAHQVANWSARRGCWIYELEMLHRKNVWLRDYMALMRAPLCPGPSNQGILQRIPWSRKSRWWNPQAVKSKLSTLNEITEWARTQKANKSRIYIYCMYIYMYIHSTDVAQTV